MFCTNCGKRIIDTARFCNYCGAKIVDIDENSGGISDNITENPVSLTSDNVINTENVENSGNLLKMTGSVPSYIPKMNEQPKSGYSPDSMPTGSDSGFFPETSGLSEMGQTETTETTQTAQTTETAPTYLDPAADPYAAQTASGLPEAGQTETTETTQTTETAPAYLDPAADPYAAQTASGLPEMGQTETTQTAQTTPTYLDPAADPYAVPTPSGLPKEEAPRKYTIGHLIMCLAASGVMAIVAGVFAGLYFSVV